MFSLLPSVSQLSEQPMLSSASPSYRVRIARDIIDGLRNKIVQGTTIQDLVALDSPEGPDFWGGLISAHHNELSHIGLRPVINATGVIVHTNLGRAPLAESVVKRLTEVAGGYSDLEMSLDTGKRGGRLKAVRELLCELTGAEDAVVVNNNAAATMLAVTATSEGKSVIVSRGELVEIGGSFRVPDVISNGGARLVEVGTTNRTRVADFAAAIDSETGALLRVHPSNFQLVGFTERAERAALAQLAIEKGVVAIEDLGSGLLDQAPKVSLPGWSERLYKEESIRLAIAEGMQLVTFSGDKLLGGPQMGCIVGSAELISRCREHPLYRALRADKICLAAFEGTLLLYREGRASELPIWRFIERSAEDCRALAGQLALGLESLEWTLVEDESFVGGGSLPQQALPTVALRIETEHPQRWAQQLRSQDVPIVVRVVNGGVQIDPRTLFARDIPFVIESLCRVGVKNP